MKKYLPLLAIFGILAVIIGMSQYADSVKNSHEESTKHAKDASIAKNDDHEASNNAKETYKPPVWAKFVAWPEGVGAWALILTLFAIVWQSIETRQAAGAALLNAQALIKSERPWLIVNCGPVLGQSEDEYFIEAVNVGRTPAELCEMHHAGDVHQIDFKGPSEDFQSPAWLPLKTFIVTGVPLDVGTYNVKSLCDSRIGKILDNCADERIDATAFTIPPQAVFIYGRITYWDTFSDRKEPGATP